MTETPYRPRTRIFIDSKLEGARSCILSKENSHYLINVLRSKTDEHVILFNGRDGEWLGKISLASKKQTEVSLIEQIKPPKNEPDLWYLFAPIKKLRIDFVAQKVTEMGVAEIFPVVTQFTNVERVKTERLQANALEAAQQCGRLNVPKVHEVTSLENILQSWPEDRHLLFCDERLALTDEKTSLDNSELNVVPKKGAVLIGPEGGFSDRERTLIHNLRHAIPVKLGPRILRADTAGIAALTIWQTKFGDWTE